MAAASILAVACSKMDQAPSTTGNTLKAYAPENTKTTIDGLTVKWAAGDALYVYGESSKTVNYKYVLDPASAGSTTGTFNAEGTAIDEAGAVMAFYPYSWSFAQSTYSQITIPSSQDESTIGDGVLPLWGKGTLADGLTFQHLGAILRLKLYTQETGINLTFVRIQNDSRLAGRIYTYDAKNIGWTYDPTNVIQYTCNKAISTDPSNPTVVDILIGAYRNATLSNLNVTFATDTGASFTKTMTGPKTVKAGSIVEFSNFEWIIQSSALQIKYGEGDWQDFDGTVGDLSGVGSIAVKGSQSRLVESHLSNIATAIKNADHTINLDLSSVSYITDRWPGVFKSNTHIGNLSLPNNITSTESFPFQYSSLQKLTIPASYTSGLDGYILRFAYNAYCEVATENTAYKSVDGSVYSKDGKTLVVADRTKVTFTVPSDVTTIGAAAFSGNNKIETLVLSRGLESIVSGQNYLENLSYIDASAVASTTVPTWGDFYYDMTILFAYPGYSVSAETTKTIKVPAGRENDYKEAWAPFFTPTPGSGSCTSWKPWVVTSDGN